MKIINNRVVCTGCEEPFEVGQKAWSINRGVVITAIYEPNGEPMGKLPDALHNLEYFHEGCD